MSELLTYVLIIVIVLVIVSAIGIEDTLKAIIAGIGAILVFRFLSSKKNALEGFEDIVSSSHVNSSTSIPGNMLDERRIDQEAVEKTKQMERALALDHLFGPPAMKETQEEYPDIIDDAELSNEARRYQSIVDGEYGQDHQYMDEDTDLAFAVESARRGRMVTEQLANRIKATSDTWKDIYEPELRAGEDNTRLRL